MPVPPLCCAVWAACPSLPLWPQCAPLSPSSPGSCLAPYTSQGQKMFQLLLHPLSPPALVLRHRETFYIVESVRVTTEESYFGTYFGSSHALQEMERPHVRSGHLYNKNLARRGRSFLPAKMDPAKPFSVKNRFLNIFGITRDSAVCVCFHADRSQVLSCAAS